MRLNDISNCSLKTKLKDIPKIYYLNHKGAKSRTRMDENINFLKASTLKKDLPPGLIISKGGWNRNIVYYRLVHLHRGKRGSWWSGNYAGVSVVPQWGEDANGKKIRENDYLSLETGWLPDLATSYWLLDTIKQTLPIARRLFNSDEYHDPWAKYNNTATQCT